MTKDTTKPRKGKKGGKGARKKLWRSIIASPLLIIVPVIVLLFSQRSTSYRLSTENQRKIEELRAEIKQNRDSTAYYKRKAAALDTDPETLERIAREQYGMKRDDEEVYITTIK